MATDPRLESYLAALEKALKPLPVSDRADIVTEMKSHALSALERDPQQSLDQVLEALGSPETVANRYLMERGHQTVKPPISPIVKWLVIGFLGTMALILLFVGSLIWKFSPVVRIDEDNDRVSLLGGMIDVDGKNERIKIGSSWIKGSSSDLSFDGNRKVEEGEKRKFRFKFSNGRVELSGEEGHELSWSCKTYKTSTVPQLQESAQELTLDLGDLRGVRCEVTLPKKLSAVVQGGNGRISLQDVASSVDVQLNNGKVEIDPSEEEQYRYDVSVGNGKMDSFESSKSPGAHEIRVHLGNGRIDKVD